MTVRELIVKLLNCDMHAEVVLEVGNSWHNSVSTSDDFVVTNQGSKVVLEDVSY